MKRLIVSALLAAGSIAVVGPALADEDCQAGSAWGTKEGCGGPTQYGLPMGAPQAPPLAGYPYANGDGRYPQGASQYPYERRQDKQYNRQIDRRQLNPTRGDRDGDGVANRQDRYPDDPSRW